MHRSVGVNEGMQIRYSLARRIGFAHDHASVVDSSPIAIVATQRSQISPGSTTEQNGVRGSIETQGSCGFTHDLPQPVYPMSAAVTSLNICASQRSQIGHDSVAV